MNREVKAITLNKLLLIVVYIFINTFFSIYFFNIINYNLLAISKYYLTIYIGLPLGFYLTKNQIKKGYKREYYQIGISLTGVFLLLILLLKEKIVNFIPLLGIVNGLSQGFYYYPTNIYDTELVINENRNKYTGYLNMVNMLINIIVPLVLGYALNKISYIQIGKIMIIFIIIMFINGFFLKNKYQIKSKFKHKEFLKYFIKNLKKLIIVRYLEGLTYSSSVLSVIITYYNILYLNNSLYVGILTSITAILALITCYIYSKRNKKYDNKVINITLILTILSLLGMILYTNIYTLCIYQFILNSLIIYIQLLSNTNVANTTNNYKEIKKKYKAEYHLTMELILNAGRITGFIILMIISTLNNPFYLKIIISISLISYLILLLNLKDLEWIKKKKSLHL